MGPAEGVDELPDAPGGRASHPDAARLALGCFARNASGSTAIEYALITGMIFLVIVATVGDLGKTVLALFEKIQF
jgi:Flp pilus assembly pilin Flp